MTKKATCFGLKLLVIALSAQAAANELNPDISVQLDGTYKQNDTALSHRAKGFSLGHTEISLSSSIDDQFEGRLTAVLEDHDQETEVTVEEAYFQSIALPYGLSVRGGRFLSQVGYLNGRHMHEDDFVERPAPYRAMLGSHYFDDGIRANLLLPTPFYWLIGAEAFAGDRLSEGEEEIGVYTLKTQLGGDIGISHSWQAGFSLLKNEHSEVMEDDHDDHDDHDHDDHDHAGHSHAISYTGENMFVVDGVWKWAPNGNNKEQQIALSGEYIRVEDLNQYASSEEKNEGWYTSLVYQFTQQWSLGIRYGEVDLYQPHGDHFHQQSLEETDFMVAWSRTHNSTLRLQYSQQTGDGFDTENSVILQYLMNFGTHGAHSF